ncbi:sensor histidine kinase, partial [Crossiella equi]|uniref:sensor histidine kinase n=1 Tax=Crossiella equi TaxID=130796 RepID=UPI000A3CEFBE
MRTRWLERLRAEPRTIAAEVSAAPRGRVVAEALLVAAVFGLGLLPAVSLTWLWPSLLFSSLLAAVLVLFRLRRPGLAFAACSLLLVFGQLSVLPAATVLSFHAGRRVRPLWRLWLLTAFVLVVGILPEWPPDEGTLLGYLAVNAAMIVVPVLAGQLIGTRRPLARVLHDRNAYLAQVRELTAAEARGAERAHIAAEMHDLLGHRLALLSMHAGALEVATRKQAPRLSEQAQLLRTTAGTAMAELRDILGVLRVGESAELDEDTGTTADLARLVAESRRVGMDVELDWQGPDLSEVDVRVRRAVHPYVHFG